MNAFFFDADGVLYTRQNHRAAMRAVLARHGVAMPAWSELWARLPQEFQRAEVGQLSHSALFEAIMGECGVSDRAVAAEVRAAMAAGDADITLREGVRETLSRLNGRGVTLGVVSNSISTAAEKLAWLRAVGLDVAWDCFVCSCEAGARKPDAAIYRLALDRCGVTDPRAAGFVGHNATELAGARAAGMTTIAVFPDPGAEAHADVVLERLAGLLDLVGA